MSPLNTSTADTSTSKTEHDGNAHETEDAIKTIPEVSILETQNDSLPSLSTQKRRFGASFFNLSVHGSIKYKERQPTFASTGLFRGMGQLIRSKTDSSCNILKNLNGLVRKGEMLMVLGQPGSGCSTLLKVLSGEVHGLQVERESRLYYEDGITYVPRAAGDYLYLAEVDAHFPELTVNETLSFASLLRPRQSTQPSSDGQSSLDEVVSAFDLNKARNTFVGDHIIAGISGGEKVRTSLAEAFVSDASLQCWDNCTRGLDSSTALKVMKILRKAASSRKMTVVTSVYQASQSMCEIFDKVTLLYQGSQIYFGTFNGAQSYFESLGFIRPPSMSIAEFLLSVTNPEKRIVNPGHKHSIPRTVDDFIVIWQNSTAYCSLRAEIEAFEQQKTFGTISSRNPVSSKAIGRQITTCVRRGFQRLKNNPIPPISGIVGQTIIGIILGTVFLDLPQTSSAILPRSILLFYAVMINACTSAFEVLTMWAQRPIVEKQARYKFYLPFTEAMASMICDLPNKLVTTIFFNTVLYFMTGLRRTASAFFTYLIFVFVCLLTMSMFFRMIGSMSRTLEQTMAPVAILILNYLIYAGFVIPTKYMHPWLSWIRYINPIAYAYESLMVNEFWTLDFRCDRYIPSGPEYANVNLNETACATPGSNSTVNGIVQGFAYLETVYDYSYANMWRNLGILLSMATIFCIIHLATTEYIRAAKPIGQILVWSSKQHSKLALMEAKKLPDQESLSIARHDKALCWSNLSYTIKGSKQTRAILQNVDGWVKPGQLTVVMGPTGAGKTTLLNILADRVDSKNVQGEILLNGSLRDAHFRANSGYVQQTDIHHPYSTVREALVFCALLRQSSIYSKAAKLAYVEAVLKVLNMESYADAMILAPGESLNTEQRRRLTIALELVARPELLMFFDEPTSGLDSETAWSICTLLRKLADNGQSVLCTIHQPSASLFNMFDQLLLLDSEGKPLYFGPTGTNVIDYFASRGATSYTSTTNPAEWLLDIASGACETGSGESWANLWQESEEKLHVKDSIQSLSQVHSHTQTADLLVDVHGLRKTSFVAQVCLVTNRKFLEYWRSPSYLYSKLFLCAGAAFFNGFSFYNTPNTLQGLQNALFSIFLLTVIFSNIDQQIIPRLIDGRGIFEAREQASQTYSWMAFLCGEIIVEAVWQTLVAILVFIAWYYPTGMWRNGIDQTMVDQRSILIFLLIWTFCLFCSTFSQAVAIAVQHAETAVNLAQLFFYLCLIFCGVIVQGSALPRFWRFMYRVSPLTYLIAGMAATGLSGTSIECAPEELTYFLPPANMSCELYMQPYISRYGGSIIDLDSTGDTCRYCQLSTTDDFLVSYGMPYKERWQNLGLQFVYLGINVMATFGLYWIFRIRRSAASSR